MQAIPYSATFLVNISAVFGDVLLSSVGGYSGLDGNVYASSDGLASTGFNVFANNLSFAGQWYADIVDGFSFRADFSGAANYAAIDIIGDNGSDYGVMQAFDSGGQLLGTVLSRFEASWDCFTSFWFRQNLEQWKASNSGTRVLDRWQLPWK